MRDWPFPCLEVRSSLVVHLNSHTALSTEGGGYGRKDGDEDVEDFSPGAVVVESSHSVLDVWLKVRFISQMHHDL
jgi:hypothetical protein